MLSPSQVASQGPGGFLNLNGGPSDPYYAQADGSAYPDDAAACAAVPAEARRNRTVNVAGVEKWWQESDLSDAGLQRKQGAGIPLAAVYDLIADGAPIPYATFNEAADHQTGQTFLINRAFVDLTKDADIGYTWLVGQSTTLLLNEFGLRMAAKIRILDLYIYGDYGTKGLTIIAEGLISRSELHTHITIEPGGVGQHVEIIVDNSIIEARPSETSTYGIEGEAVFRLRNGSTITGTLDPRITVIDEATGAGTPAATRDPYDVPAAKRREVVDAEAQALEEPDSTYFGCKILNLVYGPTAPTQYECLPCAPFDDGGPTIWYWVRQGII
jgi:hypothetical protein